MESSNLCRKVGINTILSTTDIRNVFVLNNFWYFNNQI